MNPELIKWKALQPLDVAHLLRALSVPWWIAGGWAIDLFVGRQTRPHGDTDVLILRRDQFAIHDFLRGWDLHKTNQPGLRPWPVGEFLPLGVNSIWCRRTRHAPWSLEFMLMETDKDQWVYRRESSIRGPLISLGMESPDSVPFLRPEIQLLFKASKSPTTKDESDFAHALPLLTPGAKEWLSESLARQFRRGHPWISWIRDTLTNT